jgi:predicted metalloendopeptidase
LAATLTANVMASFFLGWAQWRCMNVTEQKARQLARTDPHAPGRWRVNGVVGLCHGL